jgi:type IV pilus biogenesis protein CpaD/CtpE
MRWVMAVALLALLAGCTSTVSGSAAAGSTPITDGTTVTTTPEAPTTAESTVESTVEPPPTEIDANADQQYCDGTITGAFGKEMQVVVVNTPSGRIDCDGAAAVLVDYYTERPDPDPGSEPIEVAGFACNQVPHPDQPQVICSDGASLLYSMWRQGG